MNAEENELEEYWSNRYINQSTGWDLGLVSEPIRSYIDQLEDKEIRILIPGAGNAYEAEYLHQNGFGNTHIIDISALPLDNFKKRTPGFPKQQIIHGDFFQMKGQFDLIIEQTFLCSFPPINNNRERYVQKILELLTPKGKLVGLWFNFPFTGDLNKRPFGAVESEYRELFESYFTFKTFEEAYNSASDRQGKELFGILEKKVTV